MPAFHEIQYFHQRWRLAVLASVAGVFVYGSYQQLLQGQPWGLQPVPNGILVSTTAGLSALFYWVLKIRLVTEVREREVYVHFVLLWKPRQFPFSAILSAETVTYRAIDQYGGRGIRRGRDGWAYTVSGNRGVLLKLAGGERFLIGSEHADALTEAIQRRLQA